MRHDAPDTTCRLPQDTGDARCPLADTCTTKNVTHGTADPARAQAHPDPTPQRPTRRWATTRRIRLACRPRRPHVQGRSKPVIPSSRPCRLARRRALNLATAGHTDPTNLGTGNSRNAGSDTGFTSGFEAGWGRNPSGPDAGEAGRADVRRRPEYDLPPSPTTRIGRVQLFHPAPGPCRRAAESSRPGGRYAHGSGQARSATQARRHARLVGSAQPPSRAIAAAVSRAEVGAQSEIRTRHHGCRRRLRPRSRHDPRDDRPRTNGSSRRSNSASRHGHRPRAAPARGRLSCPAGQHAVVERVEVNPILVHRVVPRIEGHHRRWPALMADLVIVESPEKGRKINRILRPGRVVGASFGHVRDLLQPKRDSGSPGNPRQPTALGLDLTGGWKPNGEVIDSESKTVEMRHVSHLRVARRRAPSCASSAGGCEPVCPRGDRAGAGRAAGRRQTGAGTPQADPVPHA